MKKLFLLDAMALIYRAYYALIRSPRLTSKGKNTNCQFGFTNTLIELIRKENPTHMAVAFDTHAATERHTDYAEYKANRQEAPEDLVTAIPDVKKIIEAFQIPVLELDGFEADDIIGTVALEAARQGYTVYMVTPDKDYGQLVSEDVLIYKPAGTEGKAEILGPREVCEKWQINSVSQVIDMLAMMGDAVDNIPGIAGVGQKTAAKLLQQYHSLENVLANMDKVEGKLGEKIREGRDMAILSRKLATIITNVPVEFHEEQFKVRDPDRKLLSEIFMELEFRTLGKRILGEEFSGSSPESATAIARPPVQTDLFGHPVEQGITAAPEPEGTFLSPGKNIANTAHDYHLAGSREERSALLTLLRTAAEISFDTETTGIDANDVELVGMSFSVQCGEGYYVPLPPDQAETKAILEEFREFFERKDVVIIGQNIKYDMLVLKWYGFEIMGTLFDTMLAHYLIEPEGRRGMDLLAAQFLNYETVPIENLIGKKGKGQSNMRDVEIEKIKEYAAEDADITLQLKEKFFPLLKEKNVHPVFGDIEAPLIRVLADMEFEGIRVDTAVLGEYSLQLGKDIAVAEKAVYREADVRFNLASPRQLGEVLFEKLQLDPNARKTRTGQYATGEDVLQKLSHKHQIVENILVFRELSKLKSTYVDTLPLLINRRTGRVHTSFNQAVAVTGRLSSNNPNLQNIPIRTERGREIRKAFVPRNRDFVLVSADYSQIELRIIAALSGDVNMINAFKSGQDIHATTAAKVFQVEQEAVTADMRRSAKAVNFGIIYGVSAFGLSENIGVSRSEARQLIDNYFAQYPFIKKYMDHNIESARKKGYAETMLGRKRWLRDINSANAVVRGFAERNAINMPIQGTAADMIKLAMIRIREEMAKRQYRSRMVLQVHDELVFDTHRDEVEELRPIILDCMQSAMRLPNDVPAAAELGVGENWLEAH
jgi:DNA polymerase-1